MKSLRRIYGMLLSSLLVMILQSSFVSAAPSQRSQMAITITGVGGSHQFVDYLEDMHQVLYEILKQNGYNRKDMFLFSDSISERNDSWGTHESSTLANLKSFFRKFSKAGLIQELDRAFVVIAGHANGRDEEAMFHLRGKDISFEDLQKWIKEIPAKEKMIIVLTPQGESWLKAMAEEGVVTLAANVSREFDVMPVIFTQFFIEKFSKDKEEHLKDSSLNQEGSQSLWQIFTDIQMKTQNWYQQNSLKATEVAAIDADGDGIGSQMIEWQDEYDENGIQKIIVEKEETGDALATQKIKWVWVGETNNG